MSNHRFERFANVNIIGGSHSGEKGRILELFSGKQYGVKVLTGPDAHQKGTFVAQERHLEVEPIAEPVQPLIDRLHIRADIRRNIPHRKSVQEGQPDRIADLLDEAGQALAECVAALKPFVECIEYIDAEEDDEEWAKLRLLVKDYRRASAVFQKLTGPATLDAEHLPEQPG